MGLLCYPAHPLFNLDGPLQLFPFLAAREGSENPSQGYR